MHRRSVGDQVTVGRKGKCGDWRPDDSPTVIQVENETTWTVLYAEMKAEWTKWAGGASHLLSRCRLMRLK